MSFCTTSEPPLIHLPVHPSSRDRGGGCFELYIIIWRGADMSDENNGGAALSNKHLHCSRSAILAIVNMINYLLPEVALVDSNAGQLLQMCKAELLQTLAVEATTSALRHGAAQINANFAPLSQAFASD